MPCGLALVGCKGFADCEKGSLTATGDSSAITGRTME